MDALRIFKFHDNERRLQIADLSTTRTSLPMCAGIPLLICEQNHRANSLRQGVCAPAGRVSNPWTSWTGAQLSQIRTDPVQQPLERCGPNAVHEFEPEIVPNGLSPSVVTMIFEQVHLVQQV
jgi:hypothetical protein